MGYLGYAALFALILCGVHLFYNRIDFGEKKNGEKYKVLHIMIPEDLDYTGVFDEILDKYSVRRTKEKN